MSSPSAIAAFKKPVTILILGTGWTTSYLQPFLTAHRFTNATTSSSGREGSIPFKFNPSSPRDTEPYNILPNAETLVITFALRSAEEVEGLVHGYMSTRKAPSSQSKPLKVILLGSTGIWKPEHKNLDDGGWTDSSTPYDTSNPRAQAEDALLRHRCCQGCVLNLAGLYGGARQPWNWVERVAKSKQEVKGKGSLHLVHGKDVAVAILGAHLCWRTVQGKRWIVTDLRVYDWWEIIMRYGLRVRWKLNEERRQWEDTEQGMLIDESMRTGEHSSGYEQWVWELMDEEGIKALPREGQRLGRRLNGRDFWKAISYGPRQWMGSEWGEQKASGK